MKKLALAVVLTAAASTAFAGSMTEPVMAPEVVETTAAAAPASGNMVLPLVLLLLIGAAVASK